ncbi:conserved hypothetical protein [Ricinus communis]|uniref:Uncharacterized protein n=1 Tax=Ricinus communis TaxID=3988 RepID=B9RQR9_RICCO|nr:conserved hypothetical protein [Ricinus communis]
MAAAIAISTTLCGVRFRRRSASQSKSSESSPSSKPAENLNITTSLPSPSPSRSPLKIKIEKAMAAASRQHQKQQQQPQQQDAVESECGKEKQKEEFEIKELPLPPSKQLKETFSCKNLLTKSASTRNLVRNMSIKIPRSMSMARKDQQEDKIYHKKKGKLKHEDSIWMKTIILGEKCKVPDEDQDAAIYDSKGNRITTYHPKTPRSLPVSRQNSFIEPSAIPSQDSEKRE